eukprot:7407137-Pyramimonas_sp.AAC.1
MFSLTGVVTVRLHWASAFSFTLRNETWVSPAYNNSGCCTQLPAGGSSWKSNPVQETLMEKSFITGGFNTGTGLM